LRRIRLYIDVDGVILKAGHLFGRRGDLVAEDVGEFLDWAAARFDCYWLTAWTMGGQTHEFRSVLLPRLPPVAKKIRIAPWKRYKTEAIGDGNFLWVDDQLYSPEREFLLKHDWLDRWIEVDPAERLLQPVREEIEWRRARLFDAPPPPARPSRGKRRR